MMKTLKNIKKTDWFLLAIAILLLSPCCKADTSRPQPAEAAAKEKEPLADAQSSVDTSAREAAKKFIEALMMMDSPEGKRTLAEMRWRRTMRFPEFEVIATLSEEMFSTDLAGVRGYKRVARLAIPREGSRPFVKEYMLIAYKDAKKKAWKVFDFTRVADAESVAESACEMKTLAGDEETTPQGRLMNCNYWLMMAGKIEQAEKMARTAIDLYALNPYPDDEARYYKAMADDMIEMISRITGAQL